MRLYRLLGGKYTSVCKACGKLGLSRGMLPQEILIFGSFIRHNSAVQLTSVGSRPCLLQQGFFWGGGLGFGLPPPWIC